MPSQTKKVANLLDSASSIKAPGHQKTNNVTASRHTDFLKTRRKVSFGGYNLGGIKGNLSRKEIYEDI